MEKRVPIKRSKDLAPLSRDHHGGLLLVWKIRQGLRLNIEEERIIPFVIHTFCFEQLPHFSEEETVVFSQLPANDELKYKALQQHAQLKILIKSMENSNEHDPLLLPAFCNLLEEHIRFEERVLFPHIEQALQPAQLDVIGQTLRLEHASKNKLAWEDEFWKT